MLIIPLTGKISRHNPPLVTIGIILINFLVFFLIQAGDDEFSSKAASFYFKSGLAEIEATAYLAYLDAEGKAEEIPIQRNDSKLGKAQVVMICQKMQNDGHFMTMLLNGKIIAPGHERYSSWKSLRIKYENALSRVTTFKYGFKPSEKPLVATVTYMFLHGSFMHLLGNMIFLWLVGCALELGLGRVLYLTLYILTGIIAAWFFCLFNLDSNIPLIGASGSISGLMGAYTLLYGKSRIRVFYSLGFYFNYSKIPAIVLLPIWIGNEIFQLSFGGISHIAYLAHIGGLTSGALLGFIYKKYPGIINEDVFREEPGDRISILLEKALDRIGKLEMERAREFLDEVLQMDPENEEALIQIFNIEKLNPEKDSFHDTASRLLLHLSKNTETHDTMCKTYGEYRSISKKLKLNLDLLFRINSILCSQGYLAESESIMSALIKSRPQLQKIPNAILTLGRAYLRSGMKEKGEKCLRIISKRYPDTPECRIAVELLKTAH